MEKLEVLCLKLISAAGIARSCNIEAIQKAKDKDFEKSEQLLKEAKNEFLNAHNIHTELLSNSVNNSNDNSSMLIIHAEDQLMSAEMFQIISKEFIETYKKMIELEQKITCIERR